MSGPSVKLLVQVWLLTPLSGFSGGLVRGRERSSSSQPARVIPVIDALLWGYI